MAKDLVAPSGNNPAENQAATISPEETVQSGFLRFKENERHKFEEVRRLKAQVERECKEADLVHFSQTFKLKTPVPRDILDLFGKDTAEKESGKEEESRSSNGQVAEASPSNRTKD